MTKFSRELIHRHRKRTMSHRDFGKIYRNSLKRLNAKFFRSSPEIYFRGSKNRFVHYSDDNAKTPLEFMKSCNDFIAHKNYSIRAYVIRKALKCRQKQKF